MRTIGRPLYKTIGRVIGKGAHLASKLNYPAIVFDGNTVGLYDYTKMNTITKDENNFVSRWADQLGSGRDLLQATVGKQPLYTSTGLIWDGENDFMKATFSFVQPEKIYLLLEQVTYTAGGRILDGNASSTMLLTQEPDNQSLRMYAGSVFDNPNSSVIGVEQIIIATYNGANSSLKVDDTYSLTGNAGAFDAGGITVGARGSGTAPFAKLRVKYIIVRKVADSAEDETAIYNFLLKKKN